MKERSERHREKPGALARPVADAVEKEVLDDLCTQCLRGGVAEEITDKGRVDQNRVFREPPLLTQVFDIALCEIAFTRGRRSRHHGLGAEVPEEKPQNGHLEIGPRLLRAGRALHECRQMGLVDIADRDLLPYGPSGKGPADESLLPQRPLRVSFGAKVGEERVEVNIAQPRTRGGFRCQAAVCRHVVSPFVWWNCQTEDPTEDYAASAPTAEPDM